MTGENFARLFSVTMVLRDVQRQWHEAFAALRDEQLHEYEASRPAAPAAAEAETRAYEPAPWTVKKTQNLLLGIGAVLVSAAALLFIVYAWSRMGLGGRTMVMLGVTSAFGLAGFATHKRGLTATAEALTSVAIALMMIDAGAAYALNLAGLADVSASTYWAFVLAGSAALTAAYRATVRIHVLGIYSIVAAQFPVVLLLHVAHPPLLVWAVGVGLQALAITAIAQLVQAEKVLFEIARISIIATWGLLAIVVGTTTLLDAGSHSIDYSADMFASLVTVAAAMLIAYTGKDLMGGWMHAFFIAAFVLSVATAMSLSVHFLNGEMVFLGFAATGITLTGTVVASGQRKNTMALAIASVPSFIGALIAMPSVAQAILGGFEWTQYVWLRRFSIMDEWNITAVDVVVAVVSIAAFALNGYALNSRRMIRAALVGATGIAYVALIAASAPYWLLVSVLTAVAVSLTLTSRNQVWSGVALAFGAEALLWSLAATPATLAVLGCGIITAIAYMRRSKLGLHIALLFLFAEVAAASQAMHVSVEQTGLAWVVLASAVAAGADVLKRRDADALLVQAAVFASLGICVTSSDVNVLSIAFVVASAGAAVVAMRPHRRSIGWLSAALSIATFWTRLTIADVHVVEAYTLPVAVLTLFAGYRASRRTPELSSWTTYGTGLSIAVLPSLALLTDSETLVRPALLAWAALAMLLTGASGRMKSPLAIGAATLLLTAAVQFAPYVNHVPRWAAIGVVGTLLIVVGATYERRLHEVRALHRRYAAYR